MLQAAVFVSNNVKCYFVREFMNWPMHKRVMKLSFSWYHIDLRDLWRYAVMADRVQRLAHVVTSHTSVLVLIM